MRSKNMADLRIKLGVEEVILGIGLAERVSSEQRFGSRPVKCIPGAI
jgi:hypothetical protein